ATDLSSSILSENALTATLVTKGPAFFAAPSAGDPPVVSKPLTLSLPIPPPDGGYGLMASSGKLVFVYVILTSDGWKSGVKPLTASDLAGTFLRTEVLGLGYFQIAYMAEA